MQVREMMPSDLPTLRKIYLRARQQTFTWENAAHMQLNDFDTDTAAAQFDYGVDDPSYLPEQPGKRPPP